MPVLTRALVGGGGGGVVDPIADRLVLARGFSLANYLKSANGTLNGAAALTVGVLARLGNVQPGGASGVKALLTHGTQFNAGYGLVHDVNRPFARVAMDGTIQRTGTFDPSWIAGGAGGGTANTQQGSHYQFANFKTVLMALVYAEPDLTLWVNGVKWRTISPPGTFTAGNSGLYLGNDVGAADPLDGGIAGAAYAETAFSDAEMEEWMLDCATALDVVDGGAGFDSLWSFKQLGLADGASVPASVPDQIGATPLALNGTLSIAHERANFL